VAERIEPAGLNLEERIIDIRRCAVVVKGGRRFSFAAMVVVGNGAGIAGLGYGKAREVPTAIEKAVKDAKKNLVRIQVYGTTVPHEVRGHFGAAKVLIVPALPGTGVIAGAAVRAVLESIGVHDVLSKSVGGSNNALNLVKATFEGLLRMRGRESVSQLRGVEIAEDPQLAQSLRVQPKRREFFGDRGADRPRGPRGPKRGREHEGAGAGAGAGAAPPAKDATAPAQDAAPPPAAAAAGGEKPA